MDKYDITVDTFDRLAEKYEARFMDFDFYTDTYEKFFDLITTTETDVLDVACGPGNVTRHLLARHPTSRVHGLDLAPKMVELAGSNNSDAVFEVMDVRDIGSLDKQYDVIISAFCCPYLSKDDVAQFITDASSLLRANGLLYLSTMEDDDARSGFDSNSNGDQVYIHYHQSEFIKTHLRQNGFRVLDSFVKSFPVDEGADPTNDLFIFAQVDKDGQ